ncbi:MAG: hypothetical protein J5I98_15045 [Phaeodactylibacter sp.]|nr:hypothetical protein [Phaeodactylibacter sp.]
MSKPIVLIAGILLLALSLHGQGDVPILLTKSYKKVRYAPEQGAKFTKIEAVKSLEAKGVLKLGGKSSARLYCNGAFKELDGKGAYAVGSLFQEELRYTPMGYANLLNDRLMAAIGGPKGTDSIPAGSGAMNKRFDIGVTTPVGKAVAGQTIRLQWESAKDIPEYQFLIEEEGGKEVHSALVTEKQYAFSPGSLGLKAGRKYAMRVMQPGGGAASGKYFFTVAEDKEKAEAIKALQAEAIYQEAEPVMKKLMEAVSLEDAGFYYAADQAYAEAAQLAGKDELPGKMREALVRRRVE